MRNSLIALLCVSSLCAAGDWPQWRGPAGNGISLEKNLPDEWSASKNIQWKTPIPGIGHSSPIVVGNRIFLTTSLEGAMLEGAAAPIHIRQGKEWKHPESGGADRAWTLQLLALDATTGKILWTATAFQGPVYDNRHAHGSYASPTPTTDGKSVFVSFGAQGVFAYDFEGHKLWKSEVGKLGTRGLGDGTSPVLYDNLVLLQADSEGGEDSFLVALDKKTGKQVWKQKREVQVGWSTPVLAPAMKRMELISSGNEWITSYDPATGKELWKVEGVKNNAVPSPVFNKDVVIATAGYPDKRVIAVKLDGTGDVAWRYQKGTAYTVTPILYGDYLYIISDKGLLTCLDAKTGEVKYEGKRVPVPAQFSASLVAFDDKIFQTSEDGDTFVVKAGPEYELLRTNTVGETVYASPAISGGRIYIRSLHNLYCISKSQATGD